MLAGVREASGDRAVAAAVERLVRERPQLAPVVAALAIDADGGIALTAAALDALRGLAGDTSPAMLLRALAGDSSLFREPLVARWSPSLARRLVALLEDAPERPLLAGWAARERLPKAFYRHVAADPASPRAVMDALLVPLWTAACGGTPADPGPLPGVTAPGVLAALAPLLEARWLSEARAARYAREGLSATGGDFFFGSPVDALNVRNLAVMAGAVLDGDREGGRVQNRIPLQLSARFGIAPRSIPETLGVMDVLALTEAGVLAIPCPDSLRLAGLFDAPVPGGRAAFWRDALAPHRRRGFIGAEGEAWREGGKFDTSLVFNVARATRLLAGAHARMERFAPYYATASAARLAALGRAVRWGELPARHWRRVVALLARPDAIEPAMRVRDLGNTLALIERDGADARLPSVAAFALGKAEPVATGTGRRSVSVRAERGSWTDASIAARLCGELDAWAARLAVAGTQLEVQLGADGEAVVRLADVIAVLRAIGGGAASQPVMRLADTLADLIPAAPGG